MHLRLSDKIYSSKSPTDTDSPGESGYCNRPPLFVAAQKNEPKKSVDEETKAGDIYGRSPFRRIENESMRTNSQTEGFDFERIRKSVSRQKKNTKE